MHSNEENKCFKIKSNTSKNLRLCLKKCKQYKLFENQKVDIEDNLNNKFDGVKIDKKSIIYNKENNEIQINKDILEKMSTNFNELNCNINDLFKTLSNTGHAIKDCIKTTD